MNKGEFKYPHYNVYRFIICLSLILFSLSLAAQKNNNQVRYFLCEHSLTGTNLHQPIVIKSFVNAANGLSYWCWHINLIIFKVPASIPFYTTLIFKITILISLSMLIILFYTFKSRKIKETRNYLESQVRERTQKLEDAYQELLTKNLMIEEKNSEIELHRLQLEHIVEERTKDLKLAKQKAEESDKLKSAFLANMSHEIRTPLNAIIGFSFLLNDHSITDDERENYLKIINNNTNSLLKLIEDILDISKIEASQLIIVKDVFDLNALFFELFSIFHEEIEINKKENIALICSNPVKNAHYLPVLADQLRIKQIMINLLSNALKFTECGSIEFGYKICAKDIELFVKDTGIGISPRDQGRIFLPFVKIEEDTTAFRGTGLGLSITKNLVQLMGGKLSLQSEPGTGSCFTIYLPDILDMTYTITKTPASADMNDIDFSNKTILLVEDEISNMHLLQSFLKRTGTKVKTARDGMEAIEICRNGSIDIVLMDIKMPRLDGFEALKIIKNEFPELPVIAQTAHAMVDDRRKIFEAGFDNYLAKPIRKEQLLEALSQYISKQ